MRLFLSLIMICLDFLHSNAAILYIIFLYNVFFIFFLYLLYYFICKNDYFWSTYNDYNVYNNMELNVEFIDKY